MAELFFTSSALILAVLLVRAVLGRRMGARVRYALWLLVLARLLLPVSLGQSAVSPANLAHVPAPAAAPAAPSAPAAPMTPPAAAPADPAAAAAPADRPPAAQAAFSWDDLVRHLWIGGMAALGAWFLLCNLLLWRRLRRTRRRLSGGRVPVYAARVATPCLFGVVRPAVYVPEAAAGDPAAMDYILLHEKTHLRHGDQIWALLRTISLTVWWFHPLVWVAAVLSRRDCELCCDAAVIRAIGPERRGDYGRTLLQLACAAPPRAAFCTVSTLSGSRRQLRSRIRAIARWAKPRAWAIAAALVLALIAAACAFSGARPPEAAEPAAPAETAPDAEAALDALEASIQADEDTLRFELPAGGWDWDIHLYGRAVYEDGMSTSIHPLEEVAPWMEGITYLVNLDGVTELHMLASLPGAAAREWTLVAGPDLEGALQAVVEDRDDDATWALIRANRLDVITLVFSDLLDNPGALDGLPWDDPAPLSVRFRVMNGLLGGAYMPLDTETMGEWWDAYMEMACRVYDWQSEAPDGDSVIPWQLAQMIYDRRPAITDEQLVTSDGVRLNDTQQRFYDLLGIDEPADDYPLGGHWTYWHGNVLYSFYPGSGGQVHLIDYTASEDWGDEMPLGIRLGDSLDSVLEKLGVPAGQRPMRTIYGGPDGTAYWETGGDGLHRVMVFTAAGNQLEVAFDRQDRVRFVTVTSELLNRESVIWSAWDSDGGKPAGAKLQDLTWADDDAYGLYGAVAYDNPDNGSVGVAFCLRDDAGGLYFYPAEIGNQSYAGRCLHYLGDGAVGFYTVDADGAYWIQTVSYHSDGNGGASFTAEAEPYSGANIAPAQAAEAAVDPG